MKDKTDNLTIDIEDSIKESIVKSTIYNLFQLFMRFSDESRKVSYKDLLVLGQIINVMQLKGGINRAEIKQTEIAKNLCMSQPNVSRAVKRLVNGGYIESLGNQEYKLNLQGF